MFGSADEISDFQPQNGNIITENTIRDNNLWGICLININSTNTISNNTIVNNSEGINLYNATETLITQNDIINNIYDGISLNLSTNNRIINNTQVTGNVSGIHLINNSNNNEILNNNVYGNIWAGISFLNSYFNQIINNTITNNWSGIDLNNSNNNSIQSNTIRINQNGIYFSNSSANVNFNVITENIAYGLYIVGNSVINAINNWWGSNTNPINNGNNIYSPNGTITYNPWLILNITVNPVITNNNSTITADLTHNSNGEDTSSSGHVPDSLPVNFITNLGTIISQAYTNNGRASTIFNRETSTSGTTTITAILNEQTVQTNVTIDAISPTITANLENGTYSTYQNVTLTASDNLDPNPIIYYTLDGTIPTTSSIRYTVPLSIFRDTTTLKFTAVDVAGNYAPVQTRIYMINLPVININTGKVYSSIQGAINDSLTLNNHIIEVKSGTYTENIMITKSLTLRPVSGELVVLQPATSSSIISIYPGGNGTTIQGFIISGRLINEVSTPNGIYINGVSNCSIIGNTITDNRVGIYIFGMNNPIFGIIISDYNTIQNNTVVNNSIAGISLRSSSYNLIQNNIANNNSNYGIQLQYCNNNIIQNNIASYNVFQDMEGYGIYLINSSNNTIQYNTMTNNYRHGLYMGYSSNNTVKSNTMANNRYGIYITSSTANINFNRIVGNSINGINNFMGTGIVNATNNWWGHNTAPTQGSGGGNDYYSSGGTFIVGPWLTLTITASPSSINKGGISTISVDLTHNSNGEDTSSLGFVPNAIPVTFSSNSLGTVNSTVGSIVNGVANTTFTAGNTNGTARVYAQVDSQTVYTDITIV